MQRKFFITDLLTPKVSTFYIFSDSSVRQALEKFNYHKFTVVPILNADGTFYSTLSEGDILRFIAITNDFDKSKCEDTLVNQLERYRSYEPVNINCSFREIYTLALSQNFIPVVDDRNVYIGIIKRKDVFVYLESLLENKFDEHKI